MNRFFWIRFLIKSISSFSSSQHHCKRWSQKTFHTIIPVHFKVFFFIRALSIISMVQFLADQVYLITPKPSSILPYVPQELRWLCSSNSRIVSPTSLTEMYFTKVELQVKQIDFEIRVFSDGIFNAEYDATNRMAIFCFVTKLYSCKDRDSYFWQWMVETSNTIPPKFTISP